MKIPQCLLYAACLLAVSVRAGSVTKVGAVCTVHASPDMSDDAPAVARAFELCGKDGSIVFDPSKFHIESVLNTTGLSNVIVDLPGTLLVRTIYGI